MKTHASPEKLAGESAQGLLTSHLRGRYSFNPGMTDSMLKDSLWVRTLLERQTSPSEPVIGCLPSGAEQAGRPYRDCRHIALRLTLYAPGDHRGMAGPGHLPGKEVP